MAISSCSIALLDCPVLHHNNVQASFHVSKFELYRLIYRLAHFAHPDWSSADVCVTVFGTYASVSQAYTNANVCSSVSSGTA